MPTCPASLFDKTRWRLQPLRKRWKPLRSDASVTAWMQRFIRSSSRIERAERKCAQTDGLLPQDQSFSGAQLHCGALHGVVPFAIFNMCSVTPLTGVPPFPPVRARLFSSAKSGTFVWPSGLRPSSFAPTTGRLHSRAIAISLWQNPRVNGPSYVPFGSGF
jgi:hypothetical protein